MLRYRSFRNTDPPALVEIWRSRNGQPGLLQPMSVDLFEQFVLGRLYFDREGLQLAWDDDRPVGFAHAGFGPDETENHVVTELGTTCLILTRPDCDEVEVAAGLLARSEDYLRRRGAKVLYGGGIKPLDAFYLGLYGGSELPGILATDTLAVPSPPVAWLQGDRPDGGVSWRSAHLRGAGHAAANTDPAADARQRDARSAREKLVGRLHHGQLPVDAIRNRQPARRTEPCARPGAEHRTHRRTWSVGNRSA